jgi:hypothetical protein
MLHGYLISFILDAAKLHYLLKRKELSYVSAKKTVSSLLFERVLRLLELDLFVSDIIVIFQFFFCKGKSFPMSLAKKLYLACCLNGC